MKKTKFEKKIEKEDLHFKMAKVKAYLQMKLCLKKDRVYRHRIYEMFERDHFFDRHPNELPEPFYCMPTDIILYDLIKKSDLEKTKKGLIRLFKKCHTHKYLVAGRSNQDIVELFNQLDSTVNSGNSWYNVGIFDFANRKSLDEYIDHFQICFHNFSSSYATIEIQINLSKKFKEELASFIKNNYEKEGMCVHKHWINNKSKSGVKFGYAVSGGILSERAKCHIINERLDYVKNIFLKEISKFFPLMQFFKYGNLYGINVYETNITPFDKLQFSIYNALGIDDYYGFNFSDSERLYTSIDLIEENKKSMTNMMFIYNPNKVENYEMYNSAHNKVVHT